MTNSKLKGKTYELEIVKELKKYGYLKARRTEQYCGKVEESSDVLGLNGIHIECKHYKAKQFDYDWLEQAKRDSEGTNNIPVVFHRIDRKETVCTLTLDDFMTLYQFAEAKLNKTEDDYIQEKELLPQRTTSSQIEVLLANMKESLFSHQTEWLQEENLDTNMEHEKDF